MLTEEVKRKAPEETLRDVQPLLDEAGVTRLADITGMDRIGIPVFSSVRPDSKCLAVDSGKGITKEQARCSAAMEAIERWAHDEYLLKREVGPAAPHSVYKFPIVQGAVFNWHLEHKWVEAEYWSGGKAMVPYYHVMNYEKKLPLYEMCWQSGTNGLAIGNNREEAILHGVYEIIERDAVTIWMSDRGNRIDEQTVIDPVSRDLLNMCFEAGVEACIYDVTSDISVPAFICIMVDAKADIGIYKGYRCNLDCDLALQGAICEAAQARAVFLSGARDDRRWAQHIYESQPKSNRQWLYELDTETKVPMPGKNWTGLDLSDTDKVSLIEERLTVCGCGKVIVVDIMEREHAHVVKVMSEGLEGYWNPYLQLGKRASRE